MMVRDNEESRDFEGVSYEIYRDPLGWWYQIPGRSAVRLPFTFEVGLDNRKQREAVIEAAQDYI